jgi:hypothetical protein
MTEAVAEAEVVEAAGGSVVAGESVADDRTEVGPVEQVAGKFAVVDEIAGFESAVDAGTGVESEMDVALVEEVEGETVKADVDCWLERVGSGCGG